jgi:hypothetical protein
MLTTYLLGGFVNATVLVIVAFLLSRFAGEIYGHGLLALVLFIAGGVYVGFAVAAGATGFWFLAEFLQAIALGVLGLLGLRRSPYWLAAGWALHPLWDFFLHYVGPGHEFAPESWAVACVSFDLLVAAYLTATIAITARSSPSNSGSMTMRTVR